MRILSIAVIALGTMLSTPSFAQPAGPPVLTTCFTPGQNCEAMIVAQIDKARSELLIQSYKFTNRAVVAAMGRAQKRGVKVRLILDDSLERRNTKTFQKMRDSGIDLRLDDAVKTAHNKVIVVDHSTVITGSFNFTESAADKNAENIIIIEGSQKVADDYARNWEKRYAASRPPNDAANDNEKPAAKKKQN